VLPEVPPPDASLAVVLVFDVSADELFVVSEDWLDVSAGFVPLVSVDPEPFEVLDVSVVPVSILAVGSCATC
jgi:hypothetical protein